MLYDAPEFKKRAAVDIFPIAEIGSFLKHSRILLNMPGH